jgi:sarcosine oxidase/sarcosine oxidase subunit beta
MTRLRVGIVGAGIGGLTTAWALARRGAEVRVFDQGPIPNPMGSSMDEHRIIRHAYGAMRGYALMIPQAFAAWERLFGDLGRDYLVRAPATYCLRMDLDWYSHVSACLDHMGIAYRDIPLDTVAADLPMVNRDRLQRVVETQGAGMLRAGAITQALADFLPSQGVTLHPHRSITDFDPETGRLGGESFDSIVVAAGAWLPKLLPGLIEAPQASVQTVVYLEPPADLAEAWSRAPLLLNRLPVAAGGAYIMPPLAGLRLKAGDYDHTFAGDPAAPRVPQAAHVENILEACRMALADFGRYRILETKSCFYTVTRDERFVLRPLGARGWVVSACSGHGFKFAALMGEAAADGVTGLRTAQDVGDFMASRQTEAILASA